MSSATENALDILMEKNPNKRLREDETLVDEKIVQDMIDLNQRMISTPKENVTQADQNEMSQKTFTFLCSILPKILDSLDQTKELKVRVETLENEVEEFKNEVNDYKEEVKELTNQVLNHQIQSSSKCVIIRDLNKTGK